MSEETSAPPLADTADPGYADRLAKLRDRAEAIIKADPVPGSRADREEDRDIKEALRRRAETHPGDPQPVMRCEATYGTGDMQCVGVAGHDDAHSALCPPGSIQWTDADNAEPLPQREPGAALDCTELSPHGDLCTLTRGHEGMHERHVAGERVASWGGSFRDMPFLTAERHGHADAFLRELFDGVPSSRPGVRVSSNAGDGRAVRVRFVDLPHRHAEARRGPLGGPVYIAEPGGFALVVDRFRNLAHRDAEHANWDRFGAAIGAHVVLCYGGELDVIGWLDNA